MDFDLMTKRPAPDTQPGNSTSLELQTAFGESVRQGRVTRGFSQADLATRSGVAQQDISKIERGEINLTIRTMSRLADVLDGDVAKMLQAARDKIQPE